MPAIFAHNRAVPYRHCRFAPRLRRGTASPKALTLQELTAVVQRPRNRIPFRTRRTVASTLFAATTRTASHRWLGLVGTDLATAHGKRLPMQSFPSPGCPLQPSWGAAHAAIGRSPPAPVAIETPRQPRAFVIPPAAAGIAAAHTARVSFARTLLGVPLTYRRIGEPV
jgi:hypothetical protein